MQRMSHVLQFCYGMDGERAQEQKADNFSLLILLAEQKRLESWRKSPRGELAIIVLLTSLARKSSLYKNTQNLRDSYAQLICLEGIRSGHDLQLEWNERMYYYYPLLFSEDICLLEKCIYSYASLLLKTPTHHRNRVVEFYEQALHSYARIKHFEQLPALKVRIA